MHNACTSHAHWMRFCAGTFAVVLGVFGLMSAANAEPKIDVWHNAARLCLDVIKDQDASALRALPDAPHQIDVGGVNEVSGWFAALNLSAVPRSGGDGRRFLCVASMPRRTGADDRLDAAWIATLDEAFAASDFGTVSFDHVAQVGPFNVVGIESGVVVLPGFRGPEAEDFRVGVVNSLPGAAVSPCATAVS